MSCVYWYYRQVPHCFRLFSVSAFILTQYADLHAKSLIFSIPMWLPCNYCSICFCNRKGIITLLPFIVMQLNIANSLLIDWYCLMLCSTLSFLCGQACNIYDFSFCRWVSSCVAGCMSSMEVHTCIITDALMALTFMFIPVIS